MAALWRNPWWRIALAVGLIVLVLWKFLPPGWLDYFQPPLFWAALAIQPIALVGFGVHGIRLGILAGVPASRPLRPLAALLLSQGLNLLLPGRIAEFYKASYLRSHAEVPIGQGVAAVFLERSVDMVIVAGLSLVSLALFATGTAVWAYVATGALLIGLLLVPMLEEPLARLMARLPWGFAAAIGERFCRHVSRTVRERVFFRALALGGLTWVLSLLNVFVFLSLAGSHDIDFKGALALFVATTIGGAVPALPGGFGGYEAAAILVLRPYGYSTAEAFALGLGLHLAQFVIPLVMSAVILAREHVGVGELLKRLREEFAAHKGRSHD